MDRDIKRMLEQYYEAPDPVNKRTFLREHRQEHMSTFHAIGTQVHYIFRRSWIVQTMLFAVILVLHWYLDVRWLESVYALIPFVVMISLTESMRSYRCGMEELELSSRFSLKSVILSRLLILGTVDLAAITVIVAVTGSHFFTELVYMLVPFLFTAWGGFMLVRRCQGRDGTISCFLLSTLVSAVQSVLAVQYRFVYEAGCIWWWLLAGIVFAALLARESIRTIRMTEELAWN